MPLNEWSDDILIVELNDEPSFSEDMDALVRRLKNGAANGRDIIIDLKDVSYINSSNIASLLTVRNIVRKSSHRMRVCSVNDHVWSVLLTAGLDKIFEFTPDVSTSLASLQLEA